MDRNGTGTIDRHLAQPLNRRQFIHSLSVMAVAGCTAGVSAQGNGGTAPMPAETINHMTVRVLDPTASVSWYQGLFGLPVVARQDDTIVLRVGNGPQFIALSPSPDNNFGISHLCLGVNNFSHTRILQELAAYGITDTGQPGTMQSRLRTRGPEAGGAAAGTPEIYLTDPDGIVLQLQDVSYCGGSGTLGNQCLPTPEPAQDSGLLNITEFNHFTLFVSDQARSIALYQQLFGLPVDTYQGDLPVLRVGSGKQFLALAGVPGINSGLIHHASMAVTDFDVDRIFSVLENYGLTILGEASRATAPLQAYVTLRGPDRGGATGGTPKLYFTDPDGILIQLQDLSYCGGNGYLGDVCGTTDMPTGRNI